MGARWGDVPSRPTVDGPFIRTPRPSVWRRLVAAWRAFCGPP